jgi:hypothetical protein
MRTRRGLVAILAVALLVGLAVPAASGPREDAAKRRQVAAEATLTPQRVSVIANGETKDNLAERIYNHFGNATRGQVLIQTWVEPDWTNFEAVDIQGAVRATKIRRGDGHFAKRVAVRVELYGDGELRGSSATVNTGDTSGTVFVQTPEATGLNAPDAPCFWFTVAFFTIRWDDDTLTSNQVLVVPGDWFNPVCGATPTAQLQQR